VNVPFAIIGAVRPNFRRVIWCALAMVTAALWFFVAFLFMLSLRESSGGDARYERGLVQASG
jgi:hypothetical protein